MKNRLLLFLLAALPFHWLSAQTKGNDLSQNYEINWQLDSLIPCYHFKTVDHSDYTRQKLNVHNYTEDSLPSVSSDLIAQRLKDIGSPISLDYNDDVQAYINMYILTRRDQVERMLGLSHLYFPIFESELDRQGVPMELKYLPIVESALNPFARSRVGATGLWQFMLPTGKMYGLDVTSYIDERCDPYKATEAAVRYLRNMYKTYGDWLLVVAAYNCGPGNVNKAISRSGGKRNFWEIKEHLPRETRGYVPALIAATYVFNYATEHNLFPRMVDFSFAQDTIHIQRQLISLKYIADATGTDVFTLKDLNPELKLDFVPYSATAYVLRVPMKAGQVFATHRDSILHAITALSPDSAIVAYNDAKVSPLTNRPYEAVANENYTYAASGKNLVIHKVRSGEVVGKIASRYHVSASDIAKWNSLKKYSIRPGQNLKIYTKGKPSTAKEEPQTASAKTSESNANKNEGSSTASNAVKAADAKYHVVKSGDTLWDIANTYQGLTVEKIKSLNDLGSTNRLQVGQKLRID